MDPVTPLHVTMPAEREAMAKPAGVSFDDIVAFEVAMLEGRVGPQPKRS